MMPVSIVHNCQKFFEKSVQGVVILQTRPTQLIYANRRAARILGYPNHRLLTLSAKQLKELIHPAERQSMRRWFHGTMQGQPTRVRVIRIFNKKRQALRLEICGHLIKHSGQEVLIISMLDVTEREQLAEVRERCNREWSFLVKVSLELLDMPIKADIYNYIGNKVKALAGDAVVAVNSIDDKKNTLSVRSIHGLEGKFLRTINKLMDRRLQDMVLPIREKEARRKLLSARLINVEGGLYRIMFGQIPRLVCRRIEKLAGIKAFYSMGLKSKDRLLGSVTICSLADNQLDKTFIEIFVNQAAVVLDRRQTQESLYTSEERFRSIAENTNTLICQVDPQGRFLYANPAYKNVLGYAPDELTGRRVISLIHPDDVDEATKKFRRLIKTGRHSVDQWRFRHRNGAWKWFECSGSVLIEPSGGKKVLILSIDITARREAEATLRNSEERYRSFVHNFDGIAFRGDINFKPEFFHGAVKEITGYTEEDFVTGKIIWKNLIHKDDRQRIFKDVKNVIANRIPSRHRQYRIVRKDGMISWVQENIQLRFKGTAVEGVQGTIYDITDQKKAVEYLRTSEERLKQAENIGRLGHYVWDIKNRSLVWSDELYKIFGVDKEFGLTYNNILSLIHPDDRKKNHEMVDKILYSVDSVAFGFRIIRPNGTVSHIYQLAKTTRDKAGNAVCVFGIMQDITERKKYEESLKESEEKYRGLVDNANEGITVIQDGLRKFANPKVRKITGYTEKELFDVSFLDIIHPDDRLMVQDRHDRRVAGETVPAKYSFRIVNKEGKTRWLEVKSVIIEWEGRPATLNFLSDITEHKQALEALRQSEERYKNIVELSPDGIVLIDRSGIITSCNTAFFKLTGFRSDEIIGRHFSRLPTLIKEDMPKYLKLFKDVFRNAESSYIEFRWRHRDGSIHLAEGVISHMKRHGESIFIQAVVRDITERRKAEEAIKISLREKEVLLKEIHHRVKNNMQIISSLLNLQAQYTHDDKIIQIFKNSQSRIKSMTLIHERLYQSSDLAHIDFQRYVVDLTKHLFSTYGVESGRIQLKINIQDIYLEINRAIPCGLIVNELVSNALKHGFPEGQRGEIAIDFFVRNKECHLIVSDDGVGFRGDADDNQSRTLGLQLIKTLAEQLKGSLEIQKEGGTRVIIKFKNQGVYNNG